MMGQHENARKWFLRAATNRTDFYWRLLTCTSYGMEGDYLRALSEIEKALAEGAKGYPFNYYHGRCLASIGEFEAAISMFQEAKKERGIFYELTVSMQEAYYYLWHPIKSSRWELLAALYVIRLSKRKALSHMAIATNHFLLPATIRVAKVLEKVAKRLPILRNSRLAHLCNPDDPFFTLGISMVERGNHIAAKKLFAIAAKQSEQFGTWVNLCSAAVLTEDWQEAERACQHIINKWPNDEGARAYMERIKKREPPHGKVQLVEVKPPSSGGN